MNAIANYSQFLHYNVDMTLRACVEVLLRNLLAGTKDIEGY